ALHMMGHIEGEIRLPLVSMTDSNLQQLRSVINAYGLI
ncbi:MAG TPA: 4-hydroxy-tetrahydrodipicolinate synthase, partial [Verrucomicrobiales bacterium]|nr:4-hydroxy-tetrahydrodipicolinate synthase [Verrucomicrobiales bacterium]